MKEVEESIKVFNVEVKKKPITTKSTMIVQSMIKILFLSLFISSSIVINILQVIITIILTPFIKVTSLHYLNCLICHYVWTCCSLLFFQFKAINTSRSGYSKIPKNENAFVISNHVCWADWAFVHDIASSKGMLGSCRYFLKDSVKYLPIFGWGMWLMRMPFLKRTWAHDHLLIEKALEPLTQCSLPVWLVSFVEGTRFNEKKLKLSQEFARNNNLKEPELCLLPRCKGFTSTIKALRNSHIKYLYDVTLSYKHSTKGWGYSPSPLDVLMGTLSDYRVHIHVERIAISSIPQEPTAFLYELFERKDNLLRDIKKLL